MKSRTTSERQVNSIRRGDWLSPVIRQGIGATAAEDLPHVIA